MNCGLGGHPVGCDCLTTSSRMRDLEAQVERLTAERDEARDLVSEAWSGFPKGTENRDLRMKLATALDEWDAESDKGGR